MDFALTEAQTALAELAGKILGEQATPERLRRAEQAPEWFDRELWRALGKAGLLEVDGQGFGLPEVLLLLEQVGRTVAPVPAWATLVLGALPVLELGTSEQRARVLGGVATGARVLSAALVEQPGGRPARARREGTGFRLEGACQSVPAGMLADWILVPARTDAGHTAVLLVEGARVERQRQVATTGEPLARLILDGVRVEAGDVLGDPSAGSRVVGWMLDRARLGLCALQLGLTGEALRLTARYTTARQQFERPIATFQAVAHRAADAYLDVEACRLSLWRAVHLLGRGAAAARELAVASYWAAQAGHRVLAAAQHLHGGMGFDRDYPLHRYYLATKQHEMALGGAGAALDRLGTLIAEGR